MLGKVGKTVVAVRVSVQGRRLVCNGLRREKTRRKKFVGINNQVGVGIKQPVRQAGFVQNRLWIQMRSKSSHTFTILTALILLLVTRAPLAGQSRHSSKDTDLEGTLLNATATRADGKNEPIKIEDLALYENGFEQKIRNFAFDPSPSR